jgi:hypothetical protein
VAFYQYGVVYRDTVMSRSHLGRLIHFRAIGIGKIAVAFLTISLLCASYAIAQTPLKKTPNLGIINGENVRKGEYTFVVALRYLIDERVFCSGQIIDDEWVLTARHCVLPGTPRFVVSTGSGGKWDEGTSTPVIEKNIFRHSEFDVALLKLAGKITSDSVAKISLRVEEPPIQGSPFVAVGWGKLRSTDTVGAPHLQKLSGLEVTTCINPATICGKFPRSDTSTSKGDSGGPAVYDGNGFLESFGVLSGKDPRSPDRADYTRSDMIYLWVMQTIRDN